MGFLDKIGIKVNKDEKPKDDSILPNGAAEIPVANEMPVPDQISDSGKMVIDVDLPDELKNGPKPLNSHPAEIPPMGETPIIPQPEAPKIEESPENYEGSFKLPDYDNLSAAPVQHQISSDIDHQDFAIRNNQGTIPPSPDAQIAGQVIPQQTEKFVPPVTQGAPQVAIESSLPSLDSTPVDINKPIPSIEESLAQTPEPMDFPEMAPPEPMPTLQPELQVPEMPDFSDIQNNYIPEEVQERFNTQTTPQVSMQVTPPQPQSISPPQPQFAQPQPQPPQYGEQVFSQKPPVGVVVPPPKPQMPEKHLYMSVGNFKKLVEIVNAVGSEIRVASDAVLRVEEINSDSQSLYDDWKGSLDEMENIIIKFDKSLFNIKG